MPTHTATTTLPQNAQQVALRDRTEEEMEPILRFLVKYTTLPQYAGPLINVCRLVCDLYGHRLGRSVKIDELYVALHKRLAEEIDFQVRKMHLLKCSCLRAACVRRVCL